MDDLSKSVETLSDIVSRMDERIKDLRGHHENIIKDVESIKESNMEMRSKYEAINPFLCRNFADRVVKMEEEYKSLTHECIQKSADLNEIVKEVRGILRDGQGAMPSVLARLIMVENNIKRLTEIAAENRSLIEENSKTTRIIEAELTKVDWNQQSVQGKIETVVNIAWKILLPIIGALILWKLGLN